MQRTQVQIWPATIYSVSSHLSPTFNNFPSIKGTGGPKTSLKEKRKLSNHKVVLMFQCHTFMANIRHQNQTFGIPSGLDISRVTKRKLAGFQAHALFPWFNPEGFLRKSRQATGQRHPLWKRTKINVLEESKEECIWENNTNTAAAKGKEAVIPILLLSHSQKPLLWKYTKDYIRRLGPPQTTKGRSFNTPGLYRALWARAVAGACQGQSPVSSWVSAGLCDGLVKLGSGCVNRGLGPLESTEVIPPDL